MTRSAPRSVGTPHVKELINQRHVLSRNVSDLLTSAPLWLWLECLDHPGPAARFRLEGSGRHQAAGVGGYPAHVVLLGHGEAHSACEISLFLLESLVDGRAQRLGMARTAAALRICGGHSDFGRPGQPCAPLAHRT